MRVIRRRLDPVNFIRLGARMYLQMSDAKDQSVPECDAHWLSFSKPNDPGSGPPGECGAITKAGGSLAKRQAALENEYFYKQQKKLLKKLREKMKDRRMARENPKRGTNEKPNKEKPDTD